MKTCIFLSFFVIQLIAVSANADILFLDLNFSINEVQAARAIAKSRGEKLWLYPERSLIVESTLDKQWRFTDDLHSKLTNCITARTKTCNELSARYDQASKKMQELTKDIRKVDSIELARIVSQLNSTQEITEIIFSGHSDAGNSFGGLFGNLSSVDISETFTKNPNLIKKVNTILLWGCYSGTMNSLYNIWKKSFPSVSIFAGYERRSPLGIRESSAIFLTSFLKTKIQLLNAKTLKEAHRIFKSIDLVADIDGTVLVGDYYMTYDEADSIQDMMKRCEQFPVPLYEKFQCYDQGKPGCENPPANHQGPLRDFYTYMQVNRHCTDLIKQKYPDIPTPDYLIRLIYLDNIKKNFANHHQDDFADYRSLLNKTDFSQDFAAENFVNTNRAENAELNTKLMNQFIRFGLQDGSVSVNKNANDIVQIMFAHTMLMQGLSYKGLGVKINAGEECTPFSWVETGATEIDTCQFEVMLKNPLPEMFQSEIDKLLAFFRYTFELSNVNAALMLPLPKTKEELRKSYITNLTQQVAMLKIQEEILSEHGRELLKLYPDQIKQAESITDEDFVIKTISDIDLIVSNLKRITATGATKESFRLFIEELLNKKTQLLAN